MKESIDFRSALAAAFVAKKHPKVPTARTPLSPDAPAPQIQAVIARQGEEPTARALEAYAARLNGLPIIDVAQTLGVSIETAKHLINEAHTAIAEDLKSNLELNRQLDLGRIDGLLQTYYPAARQGDQDCANLVLKCIAQRAKLNGLEAPPDAGRSHPQNVLVWIQSQLPSINKIVDAMPLELPPTAPT